LIKSSFLQIQTRTFELLVSSGRILKRTNCYCHYARSRAFLPDILLRRPFCLCRQTFKPRSIAVTLPHWSYWTPVRRLIPSTRPSDPVGTFTAVVRYHGKAYTVRPYTRRIHHGGSTSRSTVMICGVLQGSVLSPDLESRFRSSNTRLIRCP
jgi:hypothetical protein